MPAEAASTDPSRSRPIGFVAAALFTWMNPKGWVTTIGALAAFTTADGDAVLQTAVVTIVLAGACFVSVVIWAVLGAAIARFLAKPRHRTAFNWSMAGLLVLSLVPVLW
jgi:threonine/homoserine/homoserine lactone efflux protein